MNPEKRFYEIACAFPTMVFKGVRTGDIPGIGQNLFCAEELADFLYHGGGGAWSTGEKLAVEFLLNLYNLGIYDRFNLGHALNVWDSAHVSACLQGMTRAYSGQ